MRALTQAVRVATRAGKGQERRFASLELGTAAAGRRRSTPIAAVLEVRRAEEVKRCADKSWKSALVCLGNMRKGGVQPGSQAYNVALKACAEAGEWDRAAALLADMQASGATPDSETLVEIKASQATLESDSSDASTPWGTTASAAVADLEDGDACEVIDSSASRDSSGGGSSSSSASAFSSGTDSAWPSRRSSSDCAVGGVKGSGRSFGSVAGEDRRDGEQATVLAVIGIKSMEKSWGCLAPPQRLAGAWGED